MMITYFLFHFRSTLNFVWFCFTRSRTHLCSTSYCSLFLVFFHCIFITTQVSWSEINIWRKQKITYLIMYDLTYSLYRNTPSLLLSGVKSSVGLFAFICDWILIFTEIKKITTNFENKNGLKFAIERNFLSFLNFDYSITFFDGLRNTKNKPNCRWCAYHWWLH